MVKLDLRAISEILVENIFDNELDINIRKEILNNVPDEHYDIACQVFHETRKTYFHLGFTLLKN